MMTIMNWASENLYPRDTKQFKTAGAQLIIYFTRETLPTLAYPGKQKSVLILHDRRVEGLLTSEI